MIRAEPMRRPSEQRSRAPTARGLLQRCGRLSPSTCPCHNNSSRLLRAPFGQSPTLVPAIVHEVLATPGSPLDMRARRTFENSTGTDFSQVRVHTGAEANTAAHSVNARAFTVGHHLVFGASEYSPGTWAGDSLLAHELTHVVQQRGASQMASQDLRVEPSDQPAEREAATAGVSSRTRAAIRASKSVPLIQRACGPALPAPAEACTPAVGDVPGLIFEFKRNCDELVPSEAARIASWTSSLPPGTTVELHGYASAEGDPAYNTLLSCDRTNEMKRRLGTAPSPPAVTGLFQHGATAGPVSIRRAVWVVPTTPVVPTVAACATPTNPDMSGRTFNPTTSSQATIIALHPIDAFTVDGAKDDAFAAAHASGLPGAHLGPQDAFRHCVWSCLMAQRIGAIEAEQFGSGHENSDPSSIPFDNQQDFHDNAIGRALATLGGNCSSACMSALTTGLLRTIRGPDANHSAALEGLFIAPGSTPSTPCIGPSDQPWP